MTLQFRPSDKSLIHHTAATNPSAVNLLMSECCCATDIYIEFMSCGTHVTPTHVFCSEADRAYHASLCKDADSFGQNCCQVGIGQCGSFSGNDKQSSPEAYEDNCTASAEIQLGGAHTVNGVVKGKKRHCAAVYMRLEDFKQMPIGTGGSTMAQLGWLPASAGGTVWPIAFKIGGHCFVGSEDLRTGNQIAETTDDGGTTIPACKKINAGSFNTDCAGDIMAYTGFGLAISPGTLDFSTDQSDSFRNLCANCCQAVWVGTEDCPNCPGFSSDGTSPEGGCIEPVRDNSQAVSFERAKGFAHCDCINLGVDPKTQDMTGKVQGFGLGSAVFNCKFTQCQIIKENSTIVDPANARIGAINGGCPGMLTHNGSAVCELPGSAAGLVGNAFFLGGDYLMTKFNCTNPNCPEPLPDGTPNPGPYDNCEACLCRNPECSCSCIQCGQGDCDFATCSTGYTINTPTLSITVNFGDGDKVLSIGGGSVPVQAIRRNTDPTCKANLFAPCANGSSSFEACIVTNDRSCGSVLHAGGIVMVQSDPNPDNQIFAQLVVNEANLLCSIVGPGSACDNLTSNNWGVTIGMSVFFCNGAGCDPSEGKYSAGAGSDFTANYLNLGGSDDCPPGTYKYCENFPGTTYGATNITFGSELTVS